MASLSPASPLNSLLSSLLVVAVFTAAGACGDAGRSSETGLSSLALDSLQSDDFSADLALGWSFADPAGGASFELVGAGTTDAQLALVVPAGIAHDPWRRLDAARLTQGIGNVDFEVEAKFDSVPSQRYQLHGIVAEQDYQNFVRVDFYSDGSKVYFFAASMSAGQPTVRESQAVSLAPGHRLRVRREGDQWTASISADGSVWNEMASFAHALNVAEVGVMAGNAGASPTYTALVDYFFDTATPVVPEDVPAPPPEPCTGGPYTIALSSTGSGSVSASPDKAAYDCDEVVSLTATPTPGHRFIAFSGDASASDPVVQVTMASNLAIVAAFESIPLPPPVGSLVSDDFSKALADEWVFVAPFGSGSFARVGEGTSEAQLALTVPAGSKHDPWQKLDAVRMMQGIGDVDFEVEAKFDSVPSQRHQLHGIVVEQDNDDFIRVDFYSDASKVYFFAASFAGGTAKVHANSEVSLAPGHRLRVRREGDVWTALASSDGAVWAELTSFTHTMSVADVGVMAGNAGANPTYTALVDYFFDVGAPIVPEDALPEPPEPCSGGPYTLTLAATGGGTLTASPDKAEYACDDIISLVATPAPGNRFVGFSGDADGAIPTVELTATADLSVTAGFEALPSPPPVASLVSDDFSDSLSGAWDFVDPIGDSSFTRVGDGSADAQLVLSVPAGTQHDPWRRLDAARMVQHVGNVDFEVEAKFDSVPSERYQLHGIVAEQDEDDFVRVDLYSDGSSVHFFAASFVGGVNEIHVDRTVTVAPGHRLRVSRSGDTWTGWLSHDGIVWSEQVSFVHAMSVADLGVTAGNAGNKPAYSALVDYFFDTGAPITPEDPIGPPAPPCSGGPYTLALNTIGSGRLTATPAKAEYGCDEVITLSALPDAGHSFVGLSGDVVGDSPSAQVTVVADLSVTAEFEAIPLPPPVDSLVSDDFSAELAPEWAFVDPRGDSTFSLNGAGTGDAYLALSVPSGGAHDAWGTLHAPRMMQAVGDVNFEVEAKFDSVPSTRNQLHGIVAEQDADNFVRVDVYSDDTGTYFFAASFAAGRATVHANTPVPLAPGHRLRVSRSGPAWAASLSADGVVWTQMASFTHSLAVAQLGVMAGNAGANPGYTALVDYFFDVGAPIAPEDPPPCLPGDTFSIATVPTPGGSIELSPAQGAYACGSVVIATAFPDSGQVFTGWLQGSVGAQPTVEVVVGTDLVLEAQFADSEITIDLWYGSQLEFGHIGSTQRFVNVLGHVDAGAGLAAATYSLNGGATQPLSVHRETLRLIRDGDFNLDIPVAELLPGTNSLLLTAEDNLGTSISEYVAIEWVEDTIWPANYSIDWSQVAEIQDVAQVVDGRWDLTADGVRSIEPGYDRVIAFGDDSWTDSELTARVTINALKDPEFWAPLLGVVARWDGHYDWDGGKRPFRGWYPSGGLVAYVWPLVQNFEGLRVWRPDGTTKSFGSGIPSMQEGETYELRFRILSLPDGQAHYDLKFWLTGTVEPAEWVMSTDSDIATPENGSLLLVAHNVDATFGNIQVVPLTDAPTAPSELALVDVGNESATLSWGASSDDVAVEGYNIYRDGIMVGSTVETLFAEGGLEPDTIYTYEVEAFDISGRTSVKSVAHQVRTPPVAPWSLGALALSTSRVDLSWGVPPGQLPVSEYVVYRDGVVVATLPAAELGWSDQALSPGAAHSYGVVALDGTGVSLASVTVEAAPFADTNADWWDIGWKYRLPLAMASGSHPRTDRISEFDIDFATLFAQLGETGVLDLDSLRCHEVDASGAIVAEDLPFQFDPEEGFDGLTAASGTLVVLAPGQTLANSARYFHLYFDTTGSGHLPVVVASRVVVTDGVVDEGQSCFQVSTDGGEYFFQKAAGGFSSLVDNDGNDWIDYHPSGGSGGDYRGMPNLVYPEGHFHPGSTSAVSTLVVAGPLKATIRSVTLDGLWETSWSFYPGSAALTVAAAEDAYWFLYEGTPGGLLEPDSDMCVRSDGTATPLSTSWSGDLPDEEWVYFADPGVGRSLFLAHGQDDDGHDSYRPMGSGAAAMTVFGFGREDLVSSLDQVPGRFTIGLIEQTEFGSSSKLIDSFSKPVEVVASGPVAR